MRSVAAQVAVAVVAFEYNRQSKKDGEKARKESAYRSEAESRYREQLEVRFLMQGALTCAW